MRCLIAADYRWTGREVKREVRHNRAVKLPALLSFFAAGVLTLAPSAAFAQLLQVMPLYEQRCAQCHGAKAAELRAPNRTLLAELTPERILDALTAGSMVANATGISDTQKRYLAEFLSGRPLGSSKAGPASAMPNRCEARPIGNPLAGPRWIGWGNDADERAHADGRRRRPHRRASSEVDVEVGVWFSKRHVGVWPAGGGGRPRVRRLRQRLRLLARRGDRLRVLVVRSQGRRAHRDQPWRASAIALPRTSAISRPTSTPSMPRSGALIWTQKADQHPMARITGAPALADGRLYVPVSSFEEGSGANDNYECCTFRGNVVAYDAATGKQLWQTFTVDPPKPAKKNKAGTQLYEPSGVAIWSAPTIDLKRGALYVATGNEYSGPGGPTSDAVIALDLKSGKILWTSQVTPKDVYVVGCNATRENCPDDEGPDFDFGNSAILRDLPGGKRVIVIGQKSGVVWALDPDNKGAIVWQRRVGKGSALGGLEWGSAADQTIGYFPVSDLLLGQEAAGGLHALRLDTGAPVWEARPARADCKNPKDCVQAQSAAISLMPGAVFSGTTNGIMRAYDTADGRCSGPTTRTSRTRR